MAIEIIFIFVMVCYILLLLIGIYIFYRMLKTKLFNLFGLAMFFIVYPLTFFSQFISPNLIYPIVAESSLIFLLIFIEETFYKGLRSPYLFLIFIIITLNIIDSVFRFLYGFKIPLTFSISSELVIPYYIFALIVSSQITITMVWFLCSTLKSYRVINKFKIEPWIKKRYLIILVSCFCFALNGVLVLVIPIEGGYENLFITYTVATTLILFSFGNLIGWLMPQRLKNYFNKNYTTVKEETLTEKELLQKIKSELKGGNNDGSY